MHKQKKSTEEFWQSCLKKFEDKIGQEEATKWFRLVACELEGNNCRLYVPNNDTLLKIKTEHLDDIKKLLRDYDEEIKSVTLYVVRREEKGATEDVLVVDTPLDQLQSFDNYVVGASNQLATDVCQSLVENPRGYLGPIMIYGGYGVGKTHLLNATALQLKRAHPTFVVNFIHSERFVVDMVHALNQGTIEQFRATFRTNDILLIDDCHFFIEKKRSQEELMNILLSLNKAKLPVIMAVDKHPHSIENMGERLKTFFQWCVLAAIEAPDFEMKRSLIAQKVSQKNHAPLPEAVVGYLADNFSSNIREIEGAVNKLIVHSRFSRKPITLAFAKASFKEVLVARQRNVTVERIQQVVSEFYKLSFAALAGRGRSKSVVLPRQVSMYLARKHTKLSLPEIGKAFCDRDHATILYGCKAIEKILAKEKNLFDKKLSVEICELENRLTK